MGRVIAVHAGPRAGWNTSQLVQEAANGAAAAGHAVEFVELYQLERVSGCRSCFGCKTKISPGCCVYQDDLTPLLAKIREADGLILGSPNYLDNMSAGFRALYERLLYQNITFNDDHPLYHAPDKKVLLIMTSQRPEDTYEAFGYDRLLEKYRSQLTTFLGPTTVMTCGNTIHMHDYSRFDWPRFNTEAKLQNYRDHFHEYLERAHELGRELLNT